jgi:hypothetical protein
MTTTKKKAKLDALPASRLIDARIKELGDWRGETLSRLRALIKQADRQVIEEWKWGRRCGRTTVSSALVRLTRAW